MISKEMQVIHRFGFSTAKPILEQIRQGLPIPEPYNSDPLIQDFKKELADSGFFSRVAQRTGDVTTKAEGSKPVVAVIKSPHVPDTELMQNVMSIMQEFPYTKDNDTALIHHVIELYVSWKSIERARRKVQEISREKFLQGDRTYEKFLSSETIANLREKLAQKYKSFGTDAQSPADKGGQEGEQT